MKTPQLYRLEVAPLLILPLSRSPFFSYASTQPIEVGSLITISFGSQTVEGVVFRCQILPGQKPSWMKMVSHIKLLSALTANQCALAERISQEYFTPLGKTLKHFLPKRIIARDKIAVSTTHRVLRPTKDELVLLRKFLEKSNDTWYLDTSLIEHKRWLPLFAKEFQKNRQQVLILVPELTLIPALTALFSQYFPNDKIALLHSQLSQGAAYKNWERIRTGAASIILATRQGLFAPFYNLGGIIVTEEQDESYKQWDMSPRYHGKRVAEYLAQLHKAKLLLTSGTPSAESLYRLKHKHIQPLAPIAVHTPIGPALTIVNLKLERYRRNFSPLSETLTQAIHNALAKKEQVLLYINRQGLNAFSVCGQCKTVFRCPTCHHPLTATRDDRFRCNACGHTTELFPSCNTCGHLSFRNVGFGTERIEKEVAKLFPRARTARLDSTTLRTSHTLETTFERGQAGTLDILVGTQMILKDPPLPKLSLIAMIDADSMLLFPDFQADERLFRDLSRAVRQVKPLSGQVIIQTFRPESAFFQKITEKNSEQMLDSILTEREELLYPPFARFFAIDCQDTTEKKTTAKAATLYEDLKELLPRGWRILPPRLVVPLKKKNLFHSTILVRMPHDRSFTASWKKLLIQKLKDSYIDIDPLTL